VPPAASVQSLATLGVVPWVKDHITPIASAPSRSMQFDKSYVMFRAGAIDVPADAFSAVSRPCKRGRGMARKEIGHQEKSLQSARISNKGSTPRAGRGKMHNAVGGTALASGMTHA
jgi:hypothetical protein